MLHYIRICTLVSEMKCGQMERQHLFYMQTIYNNIYNAKQAVYE